MKQMFFIFTLALALACGEKPVDDTAATLADASDLKVEQVDVNTAKLTWNDNANGEKGYRVFLRGENDNYSVEPLTTIGPDAEEYVFENLQTGVEYDFGVQAIADDMRYHSKVVYLNNFVLQAPQEPETPETPETPGEPETPVEPEQPEVPAVDPQFVPQVTKVKTSYAYIAVS